MSLYDTLTAQYNYISALASQATNAASQGLLGTQLNTVQTKLGELDTTLQSNLQEQNNVLTQQENVKRILDREERRLDQKKQSIDTILAGQRRLSELNSSYTTRYKYYNYMMFFTIIMVIVIVAILLLNMYGFIGDTIATLLYTIVIAYTIIYLGLMIADINSRDKLNFDKLATNELLSENAAETSATRYRSLWGDMTQTALGSMGYCAGPACCASGTYFDLSSGTCLTGDYSSDASFSLLGAELSSFTTLETAYKNGDITYNVIDRGGAPTAVGGAAPYTEASQKLSLYPI